MPRFVLLLHEDPSRFGDISPEEMQRMVERYGAWGQSLAQRGHYVGGHKLTDEGGRHLKGAGAALRVTDGPYTEAKEVIGGLFIIEAANYDAAVALSRDCPHLENGWVEVRQIDAP